MKQEDAAKYLGAKNPKWVEGFETLAWSKRMVSRGCVLPHPECDTAAKMEQEYNKKIEELAVPVASKKVVNIQELVEQKAQQFIADLEGLVDEYGITGNYQKMDAYKWMTDNGVKSAHVPFIINHFKKEAAEPMLAAEGKDADLVEGYSSYTKKRMMNLLRCYGAIVADASKFLENKKVARKPRKKKPISAEKKVSKIKYMKADNKLKLQSVDPIKIVGASQLWVYNVKTRKLGVYVAMDASGLSVKGSSIEGYAASSSISKTLRKPEKVLPDVVNGGKLVLRKVMDGVNSKPSLLNGRVNADTILLRVV
jgi:hypothetical protein